MPQRDLPRPQAYDAEELLADIRFAVRGACRKRGYYHDQSEADGFVSRIALALIDNDAKVLRSFEHRSERRTWLFTIADRVIQRQIRSRKRIAPLENAPPQSFFIQPDQEERLFFREMRESLLEIFSDLTPHEQKLLCLWLQEFSVKEIAKELGIKQGSAHREKSALKKKIQRIIKEQ